MESVEVWMWIIAGLLISGLILVGGFNMISKYIASTQLTLAQDNLVLLKGNIENVCIGGRNSQEIKSYVIPYIVSNISSDVSTATKPSRVCMAVPGEGEFCHEIRTCNTTLEFFDLSRKDTLFYKIRRALKGGEATNVEFTIKKLGRARVNITAQEVYLK